MGILWSRVGLDSSTPSQVLAAICSDGESAMIEPTFVENRETCEEGYSSAEVDPWYDSVAERKHSRGLGRT